MKKAFTFVITALLLFSMAGCNARDTAKDDNPSDDPGKTISSDIDDAQNPEETPAGIPDGWNEILTESGFVSNETAYGMTRAQWRDLVGEPDISQTTYYDDFQADIYYVRISDTVMNVIELDFELSSLGDESKPSMIRMVTLDNVSLDEYGFSGGVSGGTLGLTEQFRGKPLADITQVLGEPMQSDPDKWGFATWYGMNAELSVYLDADGNVLYFQYRSVMDDAMDSGEQDINGQDGASDMPFDEAASDGIPAEGENK